MAFTYQSDFASRLQQKLTRYYQRHAPAKIHLNFDLPRYLPGDTAFYNIQFFTAKESRPVAGRQILDVRLLDSAGRELHESKVLVVDGVGFNQLPLSADLPPGRYSVVAFSDEMKIGGNSALFQYPVWVMGAFKMEERSRLPVSFFPEGGSLVSGITNKVVVTGKANTSGKILSDEGLEIASYRLNEDGMGIFFMTPLKDVRYVARGSDGTETLLPAALADGIGILASVPINRLPIRVTLQVPPESSLKSRHFVLAATSHGLVYYTAGIAFNDRDFLTFSLPQENLPEGIATITVFSENGIPHAERLVYVRGDSLPEAKIILQKEQYQTRELIPVEIYVPGSQSLSAGSSLAVTVYHHDYLAGSDYQANTIFENAMVYGELSGPASKTEGLIASDPAQLDNFLITRQRGTFQWKDVWSEEERESSFREFLHVRGRVQRMDGRPLPDSTVVTFFFQRSVMTYAVDLDGSGDFDLPVLMDFYGDEEIYYLVESGGHVVPDAKVITNPRNSLDVIGPSVSSLPVKDEFFTLRKKLDQVKRAYSYHMTSRPSSRPPSLNALVEDEVFGADFAVSLDDYFTLATMSEVLRELVPVLQHRKQKDRDIIKLFFDDRNRFAEGEPLFIIDGVIPDDVAYFLSLKPSDVATIKVIFSARKLEAFGAIGKNGIVLVETKIPGHAALVPRNQNVFTAQGLELASPANTRRAIARQSRAPDLRTNLYWNPNLMTDSVGRATFFVPASDVTGTFRIVAEGFTADRKPFSVQKKFEVVFE